jgi:hypothetical protein
VLLLGSVLLLGCASLARLLGVLNSTALSQLNLLGAATRCASLARLSVSLLGVLNATASSRLSSTNANIYMGLMPVLIQ